MRICKLDKTEQIWGRGGPVITTGIAGYGNAAYKPGDIALPSLPTISTPVTTQATFTITPDPTNTTTTPNAPATPDYASMCPPGTTYAGVTVNATQTQVASGVTIGASPSVNTQVGVTAATVSVNCPVSSPAAPASSTSSVDPGDPYGGGYQADDGTWA